MYFARRSASRLMGEPISRVWRWVSRKVCGVIQNTADARACSPSQSSAGAFSSAIVREIPSMAMLPLSMQYLWMFGGSEISRRWSWPWVERSMSVPVASTWPWTKCPPRRWVGRRARSRFTVEPTLSEPREVTFRVWWRRSKDAVPSASSETVRQQPLVATESPSASSLAKGMAIS